MSAGSRIGWTDATWNPTTGCDRVSAGCDRCYALALARRLKAMGQARYQNDGDPATSGPGFGLTVHPDVLDQPLHWRNPRMVFVNSMGELFHDRVPDEFIVEVFAVMAATRRHTYQILTKRHGRMRSLLSSDAFQCAVGLAIVRAFGGDGPWVRDSARNARPAVWPLPNVWLGVSVEHQRWADIRIPALLDTPAAVRWVSVEPLLSPVDLSPWIAKLDWVVVGGESGPGYRPMGLGWLESLAGQCTQAGVPVFVKQDSGPKPGKQGRIPDELWQRKEYPSGASKGRAWA